MTFRADYHEPADVSDSSESLMSVPFPPCWPKQDGSFLSGAGDNFCFRRWYFALSTAWGILARLSMWERVSASTEPCPPRPVVLFRGTLIEVITALYFSSRFEDLTAKSSSDSARWWEWVGHQGCRYRRTLQPVSAVPVIPASFS